MPVQHLIGSLMQYSRRNAVRDFDDPRDQLFAGHVDGRVFREALLEPDARHSVAGLETFNCAPDLFDDTCRFVA